VALAAWWVGRYVKLSFSRVGRKSPEFFTEFWEVLLRVWGLGGMTTGAGNRFRFPPTIKSHARTDAN